MDCCGGWMEPSNCDWKSGTDGIKNLKPKKEWTTEEKNEAKFNAKALSAIFGSLPMNQFTRVQGCMSAKEAWDILQVTFEGTSTVKRTRLDMLASEFENLNMGEDDSVDNFSSKLSAIQQEAVVLGKTYKDKKLVKKFLRSLPSKFQAHISAIEVSLNSDEMKFDQVVGMMKAYELNMKKKDQPVDKGVALTAADNQKESLEDTVGLIARKFFKRFEKGQRNVSSSNNNRFQRDKEEKKGEKQCAECEGYGHFKADCPTIKRRSTLQCYECKGYGHTKTDCLGLNNSRNKSYVTWSESDSEEEDGVDILNNFMAHLGIIEEGAEDEGAESDDEEMNLSIDEQLEDSMTKKGEIKALTSENKKLSEKVSSLEKELSEEKQKISEERQKNSELSRKLEDQLKNIRMLSSGTKELEKVLTAGRTSNDENRNPPQQVKSNPRSVLTAANRLNQRAQPQQPVYMYGGGRAKGCWYCGKPAQIWIKKEDLYCNMALISEESSTCNAEVNWFFDSGCSQHMTGNEQLLRSLEFSSSRRVMLGDGSHCIIRGQGRTTDIDQPLLEKVQLVEGLKANLIIISRLCDDGCEVSFTNSTCKVLDAQGNVKFTGLRTENHCYEWTSNGEGQRLQDDEFNEVTTVGEDGWEEDEVAVIVGTVSTTSLMVQ
ncbi:Zinc finger CCHC-type [Arabidopsis thaliana x Arabidopsis arenosa]|uniref:Zinc finger CCHC-type n=1 Tax=Arabidopsis thaliana x Arabidopsis arenosa TaxID=1240361 RepID=A0A8T1YEB5_9BRAS|nr:Zinc finger CCHC-type [Arabidopsis thaliana x Arabidopsis arenosa]